MKEIFVYNESDPYTKGKLSGFYTEDNIALCVIQYEEKGFKEYIPYDGLYYSPTKNCLMYNNEDVVMVKGL